MAKTNAFEIAGWVISAFITLVTMMAVGATYIKWVVWAGSGWLW